MEQSLQPFCVHQTVPATPVVHAVDLYMKPSPDWRLGLAMA
jgi:hypothetical protein